LKINETMNENDKTKTNRCKKNDKNEYPWSLTHSFYMLQSVTFACDVSLFLDLLLHFVFY